MLKQITLRVNGKVHSLTVDPQTPLLYVLRNDLGLSSPKYGCGLNQCGACTVIIDGEPANTCALPVEEAEGHIITTLEALAPPGKLHPLQQAFIDEQAAQCGYCTSGLIMSAKTLLDRNPSPSEADIREALKGVLCRCGTHARVIRAVQRAAKEMSIR